MNHLGRRHSSEVRIGHCLESTGAQHRYISQYPSESGQYANKKISLSASASGEGEVSASGDADGEAEGENPGTGGNSGIGGGNPGTGANPTVVKFKLAIGIDSWPFRNFNPSSQTSKLGMRAEVMKLPG
jgi:hypothetical protein